MTQTQTRPQAKPQEFSQDTGQVPAIYRWRDEWLTETRRKEIIAALPAGMNFDRFLTSFMNAVRLKPELMDFPTEYIWREVARAARLGLSLEPIEQEAWIIVGESGEPELRVGWRGVVKMVRQSPGVTNLYPVKAHEKDHVVVHEGTNRHIEHKPVAFGDRGPVVGYYAVIKYGSGEVDFELMSVADVEAIRNRTKNWKAFEAGRSRSSPWATDFDEMAKKTVILRLCKRVPKNSDAQQVINAAIDGDTALDDIKDVTPPDRNAPPPAGRPKPGGATVIEHPATTPPTPGAAGSAAGEATSSLHTQTESTPAATTSQAQDGYVVYDAFGDVAGTYATADAWTNAVVLLVDQQRSEDNAVAVIDNNRDTALLLANDDKTSDSLADRIAQLFEFAAAANARTEAKPQTNVTDLAQKRDTGAVKGKKTAAPTEFTIPLKDGPTGRPDWVRWSHDYSATIGKATKDRFTAIVSDPVNVERMKGAPAAINKIVSGVMDECRKAFGAGGGR